MSITSDLATLSWADWLKGIVSAAISAAATVISANPIAAVVGAQSFTLRQLGIVAGSAAFVAVANFLRTSPFPTQREGIALLAGVHTAAQVDKIVAATSPGVVPSPEVAAAILNGTGDGTVKP